jgi:hypothetical protein
MSALHRVFTTAAGSPAPVDSERVERWTSQIAADDMSDIAAAHRVSYGTVPAIRWNPKAGSLPHEKLEFVLAYWERLRGGRDMPRASEIDPLEMGPALGYLSLVDPADNGDDFNYRLYGSTLAAISGFDMTGRRLSTFGASLIVVEFVLAAYRAAFRRQAPLYTLRAPRNAVDTANWHTLLLPLADESGAAMRFLSIAVPLRRDGRLLTAWL